MKKLKVLSVLVLTLIATSMGVMSFADEDHETTQGETIHIKSEGVDITTAKVARMEGMVDSTMERKFIGALFAHRNDDGPQIILINSRGGRVDSGKRMIEAMAAFKTSPTVCVVEGDAMSMAFNFLSFCDVRLATKGSLLLAHKMAIGGMLPMDVRVTAKFLRQVADDMDKEEDQFRLQNAKAMGLSLPQYDVISDQEVMWEADSLVRGGYLQGIVTVTGE